MAITQNPLTHMPHGYDSIMQNLSTIPSSIPISTNTNGTTTIPSVNSIDYIIQGKMLTTTIKMSPYEAEQMDELEMKNRLITLMVREIMDNKCIEFTKQQDFVNDEVIIRARIYVTPDSDVKLIRQVQK
jgi:hypothetical protein